MDQSDSRAQVSTATTRKRQMGKPLSINEAAYLAKRSRRTIYNWIEWGALSRTSRYIDSDELFKVEATMSKRIGRPKKNLSNLAQGD